MSDVRDYTGWIARSAAGRDRGGIFCVVGADPDRECLLLADGKRRKLSRPKAKRFLHLELLADGSGCPTMERLKQGGPLTDAELRRTLAAFRDEMEA